MVDSNTCTDSAGASSSSEAVRHLRAAVNSGRQWPVALLEAMALWSDPDEVFRGRQYRYLIGGEAFDWLLLAERILLEVDGLVPLEEKRALLGSGRLPDGMDTAAIQRVLGVEKFRGYLNFYYGVTVERSLQMAARDEVRKRNLSNGLRYRRDVTEEAFERVYGLPRRRLLRLFRAQRGDQARAPLDDHEEKEFTYWLFKYRVQRSEKARLASDTRRGLQRLSIKTGRVPESSGDR